MDKAALDAQIRACTLCPLHLTRTIGVPAYVGEHYNGLAIMGEAPGRDEDLSGKPFMGRAGALLDEYLSALGLSRDQFMLLNRIRCRPPNNDIRSSEAIAGLTACDKWTQEELNANNPRVVICMGRTAAKPIFGNTSVSAGRGTYTSVDETSYVYTYHPAAALRSPELGKFIMQDIQLAVDLWKLLK